WVIPVHPFWHPTLPRAVKIAFRGQPAWIEQEYQFTEPPVGKVDSERFQLVIRKNPSTGERGEPLPYFFAGILVKEPEASHSRIIDDEIVRELFQPEIVDLFHQIKMIFDRRHAVVRNDGHGRARIVLLRFRVDSPKLLVIPLK